MDNITLEGYKIDMAIKNRAEELGCIYDIGSGRRYSHIGPESRVLCSDVDGCLIIDSQRLIYEEAGIIDPLVKPEIKADLEKQIGELITNNAEIERQYKEMAQADNTSEGELAEVIIELLKDDKQYQLNQGAIESKKKDLEDFLRRRDIVLCRKDPNIRAIDYRGIYRRCQVDENACKLINDNVGPEKLFTTAIALSHFNDEAEVAKIERIREYLNIAILLIRWPKSKLGSLKYIHGIYCYIRSLLLDDDIRVINDAMAHFSDVKCTFKSADITTSEALERGFQKVKTT